MNDKLTIVGPEPWRPEEGPSPSGIHIQALLLMAKYDRAFRDLLLADRKRAIAQADLPLSPGEKLLLQSISNEQLEQSIGEFRIPGIQRTSLPSWAKAAAVVLLLTSLALSGSRCRSPIEPGGVDDIQSLGANPDSTEVEPVRGSIPDLRSPPIRDGAHRVVDGAAPDEQAASESGAGDAEVRDHD